MPLDASRPSRASLPSSVHARRSSARGHGAAHGGGREPPRPLGRALERERPALGERPRAPASPRAPPRCRGPRCSGGRARRPRPPWPAAARRRPARRSAAARSAARARPGAPRRRRRMEQVAHRLGRGDRSSARVVAVDRDGPGLDRAPRGGLEQSGAKRPSASARSSAAARASPSKSRSASAAAAVGHRVRRGALGHRLVAHRPSSPHGEATISASRWCAPSASCSIDTTIQPPSRLAERPVLAEPVVSSSSSLRITLRPERSDVVAQDRRHRTVTRSSASSARLTSPTYSTSGAPRARRGCASPCGRSRPAAGPTPPQVGADEPSQARAVARVPGRWISRNRSQASARTASAAKAASSSAASADASSTRATRSRRRLRSRAAWSAPIRRKSGKNATMTRKTTGLPPPEPPPPAAAAGEAAAAAPPPPPPPPKPEQPPPAPRARPPRAAGPGRGR